MGEQRSRIAETKLSDVVAGMRRPVEGAMEVGGLVLEVRGCTDDRDFGQQALRREQREALGDVDVLILPVGGGPTIEPDAAAALVREVRPSLVVAMHYRTPGGLDFLDSPDAFLTALGAPGERLETSETDVESLLGSRGDPVVALLAPPLSTE